MDVKTRRDPGGHAVLYVGGEVDIEVADQLRAAGVAAVEPAGLAVDLSAVSFIDSTGLAALIEINNAVQAHGQRLRIVSPSRCVRRILEVTGLNPAFTIVD